MAYDQIDQTKTMLKLFLVVIGVVLRLDAGFADVANPSPQCMDDDGQPVDWYIVYKFPYLKSSDRPELFGGYHYAYMTSETENSDGWHFSPNDIQSDQSIFGQTLQPFYSYGNRDSYSAVFYSDQPATGKDVPSSFAHAKGLMLADKQQGFWLIHTVPKFGSIDDEYEYPNSGGRYGQVALCLSLSTEELTKVINDNFLVSQPYVYHLNIDSESKSTDFGKALDQLDQENWNKDDEYTDLNLKTLGGKQIRSFYKSPKYQVDLYASIVAQKIDAPMRAETWRHPPGDPLNSSCQIPIHEVENIESIQVKFMDSDLEGNFSYYDDHSKWAISRDQEPNVACIGDINRVHSQFHRGGGTTCLTDPDVWSNFNLFIEKVERCPDDPEDYQIIDYDNFGDNDKDNFGRKSKTFSKNSRKKHRHRHRDEF